MLLAFVLVIIVTWLAILSSVYSMFAPFVESFGDIVNYNVAYYGAISAVERGELVLKYKWPGFVWSGGWIDQVTYGKASDVIMSWFSIKFENKNWVMRDINSRTTRIPSMWQWNVDKNLLWSGSENYNKLDYKWVETFLLSLDNSALDSVYSWTLVSHWEYGWEYISGQFRLPPKISSGFNSVLCDNNPWSPEEICDPDKDGLYDDIVVDWSLKWNYLWNQFFVMPSESVAYYWTEKLVNTDEDTTIRESNINSWDNIIFSTSRNIYDSSVGSLPITQNVISTDVADLSTKIFKDILSSDQYTWLQLKFALVNLLSSVNWNIYPFLEYFFEFDPNHPVSDRFYTIQWNGRKWDYDIKIIIKKPTFKETVAGSFTVVF